MKNKKKLITTILVSVGVLCLVVGAVFALKLGGVFQTEKVDIAWYEEEGKEFVITTAEELRGIAELSDKHDFKGQTIKLGADIVLNEGDYTQWKKSFLKSVWNPIEGFAGTFDGQGHTISGLYCVANGFSVFGKDVLWNPAGMFIDSTDDAVIRNFRIVNSYYTSSNKGGLGSVIGRGNGTIESVYSSAMLVASASVNGGLVGEVKEGGSLTMKNCQFDGEMLLRGQNTVYTGGMIGYVKTTKGMVNIEHCLFSGKMVTEQTKGTLDVGGFIGFTLAKSRVEMKDCLASGKIETAHKRNVGSLIGSHTGAIMKMDNVYADLACMDATIGLASTTVNSYPLEFVSECFVGENALKWTELDFENYWTIVKDGAPTLRKFADKVVDSKALPKAYDTDWYDAKEDIYTISTLEELYGFYVLSAKNTFQKKTIKLGADIKVNEGTVADWKKEAPSVPYYPIKKFGGTFDGDGHTISGVYLKTAQRNSGLFTETTSSAKLTNFKLTNSYFESVGDGIALIGSVVGMLDGEMNTVYSDATVVADSLIIGGLASNVISTTRATITNCWYDGEIIVGDAGGYVGGIAGQVENGSHARIMHCLNSGTITATKEKGSMTMGGITGVISDERTKVAITDCLNVGKVSTPGDAGIGSIASTILQKTTLTLENCYATEESCRSSVASKHGTLEGGTYRKVAKDLSGYQAYELTMLDFDKYWAVVKDGTPILQSFAKEVPSLAGREKKIDTKWYKLKEDTYTLNTVADLYGFYHMSYNTDFAGKTVKLGKDITVNKGNAKDWQNAAPALSWYAIYNFAGTFDGCGHTISGIYLKTELQGRGLFGTTTPTTVIKNLRLTNSYFEGIHKKATQIGSIAGKGQGTFDTLYSDAIIVADTLIAGGIIGDISSKEKVVVTNCWYDGTMEIGKKGGYIGGIAGEVQDGTIAEIKHCLNTGTITGAGEALTMAGIVGVLADEGTKVTVEDTLAAGRVTCKNGAIGGIASTILPDTELNMVNCYATKECAPKIVHKTHGTKNGRCYAMGEGSISGQGGYRWTYLDFNKYWTVSDATPKLQSFAKKVAGKGNKVNTSWYDEKKTEFVLNSLEDLFGMYYLSQDTDFNGKIIKLGKDIDFTGYAWTPIAKFAGTFDGQMHKLNNFTMKLEGVDNVAFFAQTTDTTVVKNLQFINVDIAGKKSVATVAATGQGTFQNINVIGNVNGTGTQCAGLIGALTTSAGKTTLIENCQFIGDVKSTSKSGYVGGFIGYYRNSAEAENLIIRNCNVTGHIESAGPYVGGYCGFVDKKHPIYIENSISCVTTKESAYAGGAVGMNSGDTAATTATVLENVFTTHTNSLGYGRSKATSAVSKLAAETMQGDNAYVNAILDFDKIWTVVEGEYPQLRIFANKVVDAPKTLNRNITPDQKMWLAFSEGTKEDPYVIKDARDLLGLAKLSETNRFDGKYFVLANDIVLNNDNSVSKNRLTWTTIGSLDSTKAFKGNFDGCGHTISGLYYNDSTDSVGLFGSIANSTDGPVEIKNFTIDNVNITGNKQVGAVAGVVYGGIYKNIRVADKVNVKAVRVVGGMIGRVLPIADVTVEGCSFEGTVQATATKDGGYAGGLLGWLYRNNTVHGQTTVKNCLVKGTIKNGHRHTGGVCGFVEKKHRITVENTLIVSAFDAGVYTGGVIGMNSGDTAATTATILDNVYTTHEGLVGYGSLKASSAKSAMDKTMLQGDNAYVNTMLDFDKVWTVVKDDYPNLRQFASVKTEAPKNLNRAISADASTWKVMNAGTEADPYILKDARDLLGLAQLSAGDRFDGKYFVLANDIVVNNDNSVTTNRLAWTTIGSLDSTKAFKGNFDGCGHTISGIYYNQSTDSVGLFGSIANSTNGPVEIKNFTIDNVNITGNKQVAAVAGVVYGGIFKNIRVADRVNVKAVRVVGGLIGRVIPIADLTVEGCSFEGTVQATATAEGGYAGGLLGWLYRNNTVHGKTEVTNCLVKGTIKNGHQYTGGVCGFVAKQHRITVKDTLIVSKFESGTYTAGVIGMNAGDTTGIGGTSETILDNIYTTHKNSLGYGKSKRSTAKTQVNPDTLKDKVVKETTGFDFDTIWMIVPNDYPMLKAFAPKTNEQ